MFTILVCVHENSNDNNNQTIGASDYNDDDYIMVATWYHNNYNDRGMGNYNCKKNSNNSNYNRNHIDTLY